MRVRLFVDFWNFSIEWKKRAGGSYCDWKKSPTVLAHKAGETLADAELGALQLEETRVYASYEPGREGNLKNWLVNFLDRQPGVRVFVSERHWRKRSVHCRSCGTNHNDCPTCGVPLGRASEKGVDARIVADMLTLAWEDAYDVALLVSSDADFIPAIDHLQAKNFKVVNATWKGHGHELAKVAWASFDLDDVIDDLRRE